MANRMLTIVDASSPPPAPAQPKKMHSFQFPGNLSWSGFTKPRSVRFEVEHLPSSDDDKDEVKQDLEAPSMDVDDSDTKFTIGMLDDVGIGPRSLRSRNLNPRPIVNNPLEGVGSSSKPRKPLTKSESEKPGPIANDNSSEKKGKRKDTRRNEKRNKGKGKRNSVPIVPKFSLTLTPEEIADDLFIMTGRRPTVPSQKRDKKVQKALDRVFPGMHLKHITADDYKTSDNPKKG